MMVKGEKKKKNKNSNKCTRRPTLAYNADTRHRTNHSETNLWLKKKTIDKIYIRAQRGTGFLKN